MYRRSRCRKQNRKLIMRNLRCPLIKPRSDGGTFYTFGSAIEDIGLNINTSDYRVELSHYVILDIPQFRDNDQWISYLSYSDYNNPGDYQFANFFQCAVLNIETLLRAQDTYDFSTKETVSENLFWDVFNRLICGGTLFENTTYGNGEYYLASADIVKGIGLISGGSQRTDSYGIYNETYIQIPSSYKQTPVYFKKEWSTGYGTIPVTGPYLYGIPKSEISRYTTPPIDYITETGIDARYSSTGAVNRNTFYPNDAVKVEFSTDVLASIYGRDSITYDEMATEDNLPKEYKFNALLIYYSIYSANGDIIATNPYGLLILNSSESIDDAAEPGKKYWKFKELDKKASNSTTIGNSYAFRLNIKTSSTYSTNITVSDNSTVGYSQTLDYNDMVRYLGDAVNILSSNSQLIAKLVSENQALREMLVQAIDKIDTLNETIEGKNGVKARLTELEKT